MSIQLENKTALVTGASKGIGKGTALELARLGCNVIVNYNSDQAGAQITVAEIQALGRQAFAIGGDVGDAAAVDAMFKQSYKHFPTLDILVNNAGTQTWKALLDLTEQEWDRVIDTNLKPRPTCRRNGAHRLPQLLSDQKPWRHGGRRHANHQ